MAEELSGAARPAGRDSSAHTCGESVGAVGAITPFNFPLDLAVNKIAPALAAGNTVVHRPAEKLGRIFFEFYGQTECGMTFCVLRRGEHIPGDAARLASCGRPVPWLDVRLLDGDLNEVPAGETGEICVRGPLVMDGYWNKPAETAEALHGGRRHDPVQLRVPGRQPGQGGEPDTVSPVRLRAGDLSAQDRDLMAKHEDLRVLNGITARLEDQPAEHRTMSEQTRRMSMSAVGFPS